MTTFSLLPITAVPVQLNELKIDVMQGVKIFLPQINFQNQNLTANQISNMQIVLLAKFTLWYPSILLVPVYEKLRVDDGKLVMHEEGLLPATHEHAALTQDTQLDRQVSSSTNQFLPPENK